MACGEEFAHVNVLADPEVFQNLPRYANWPTFPQLYINGELVGHTEFPTSTPILFGIEGLMHTESISQGQLDWVIVVWLSSICLKVDNSLWQTRIIRFGSFNHG